MTNKGNMGNLKASPLQWKNYDMHGAVCNSHALRLYECRKMKKR
jgi:hypothetical protein